MSTQASTTDNRAVGAGLSRGMIGFMLPHEQFPISELVPLGIAAEQADFDLVAASDHLQPWQANQGHSSLAWLTLGSVGQQTRRIWLGPTVTCPTLRYHPAVVAEAFASLSQLYPGRIYLGVGSGEALNEKAATGFWPDWQERSERLIEATEIIRRLWSGEPVDHNGRYYQVHARLYDPPAQPIPILMAANGKKAMRRAGQYGDGLVTEAKIWREYKSEFEEGARAAGKDPAQMPVLIEQYVVVGDRDEAENAAQLWRFGPKAFTRYHNVTEPENIQQYAEQEVALADVHGEWPISNEPEPHIETLIDLFKSGATIVNIHSGQADLRKVMDFYSERVLPVVRGEDAVTLH